MPSAVRSVCNWNTCTGEQSARFHTSAVRHTLTENDQRDTAKDRDGSKDKAQGERFAQKENTAESSELPAKATMVNVPNRKIRWIGIGYSS